MCARSQLRSSLVRPSLCKPQAVAASDTHELPLSWESIYSLLQECTHRKDIGLIRQAHLLLVNSGLTSIAYIADHLIRLFTTCKSLLEADQIFCKVVQPSVYTWHALISAHMKLGESDRGLDLYLRMQQVGVQSNKFVFLCVLKICSSVKGAKEGRNVHDEIIRSGLELDMPIRNTLVDMYSKCGSLDEACHVFDRLQSRDVVSWGAMIAGYTAHDRGTEGLEMFKKMWREGVIPNAVIFLCTLRACGSAEALEQGRLLQSMIICEAIELDEDVVSWGVMITGYADQGEGEIALRLYEDMLLEGIEPSKLTYLGMLKACWVVGALTLGRLMHTQVIKHNFGCDLVIGNAVVDMYAKCGSIEEARVVFDDMPSKDGVSFNSIIQGYVQQDLGLPALDLYALMHQRGIKPNKITYPTILKACSSIRALLEGRQVHAEILRRDSDSDLATQSALADMYAKCGSMREACKVFDAIHMQDVASWGTIFAGYAQSGDWKLARQCFASMRSRKLRPDAWIFSSILAACSHAGEVEEGRWYFMAMVHEHGIRPTTDHFSCMIDLLGRAGRLEEARDMFQSIPEQLAANGWTSLLTSCRWYGHKELGSECFPEAKLMDRSKAECFLEEGFIIA